MTLGQEPGAERRFTPAVLPWLVVVAALTLYLVTLNHWVSLGVASLVSLNPVVPISSLAVTARSAGWTWQPDVFNPAYFLVTYPIHWLPARWIPLALNLFSAACAAGVLGLLARSVALLPHDRTQDERQLEKSEDATLSIGRAWLPPVLAVLACGLQLTFWEHATNGTVAMFDLLLFAFVIWSLLEYRLDGRESRLGWVAFVYGAAMANNYAMIGFFPIYLVALIWIRGLSFFSLRFLGRMVLCGLAGLSLYLLLPVVDTLGGMVHMGFWQALKLEVVTQKGALLAAPLSKYMLFQADAPLWTIALTSLVPLLIMAIRWPSYFGDTSRLGAGLAALIFHVMAAVLLVACVWVAFDPPFSPRHKLGLPFLPFYYLGALSIGYFSGYLLLLASEHAVQPRRRNPWADTARATIRAVIWLVLAAVPVVLLYRNLPQVRATNGTLYQQFASLVADSLPPSGAVLLSDDPRRLYLVQAELARRGKEKDYVMLDTQSLKWPQYQQFLHQRYPLRWPDVVGTNVSAYVAPLRLIQLVAEESKRTSVYYLHPSFGYYFEFFSLEPHGLIYRLDPYPTNSLVPLPPAKELVRENEAFWERAAATAFKPLVPLISPPNLDQSTALSDQVPAWLLNKLRLKPDPNMEAVTVGTFYSRALDYWGVEMQRSSNLQAAAAHFEWALKLNPDNVVAEANLKFNQDLRAGRVAPVQAVEPLEDQFGKFRGWDQVMGNNGPYDEPSYCYEQGLRYIQGGYYRQAALPFARVRALAPHDPYTFYARLWLAQLHVLAGQPAEALDLVKEIRDAPESVDIARTNAAQIASVEAAALAARGELPKALQVWQTALAKHPEDDKLLVSALRFYPTTEHDTNVAALRHECYTNALELLHARLKAVPDDPRWLLWKGVVCMQVNALEDAIPPLTHMLELQTTNNITSREREAARFDRAICYLRLNKLDAAQQDYEALLKSNPKAYPLHYGLAEIAYRKQETNTAVKYYELYLANAATNSAESQLVRQRLKELKGGPP